MVVRVTDSYETLKRKIEIATILGTFQSTLTDYKYIRKKWKENAEEERLLGVSLTGIMDHPVLSDTEAWDNKGLAQSLQEFKAYAVLTNKHWAGLLNITQSTSITTVKPSGTVSQLVDSASGIHPRHNTYYTRTVRADVKDPLASFLKQQGVPWEEDVFNKNNVVFSFPMAAPLGAITRHQVKAIEQLEHYLVFQQNWCEHNPSITVYVKNDEWFEVGAWVYKYLDLLGGVSFLPHNEHIYQQAPYQDITETEYKAAVAKFPAIDWKAFDAYEVDDATISMHELACVGGSCEYDAGPTHL